MNETRFTGGSSKKRKQYFQLPNYLLECSENAQYYLVTEKM